MTAEMQRIQALLLILDTKGMQKAAAETGISMRQLWYIRNGRLNVTMGTYTKLAVWAKHRRVALKDKST